MPASVRRRRRARPQGPSRDGRPRMPPARRPRPILHRNWRAAPPDAVVAMPTSGRLRPIRKARLGRGSGHEDRDPSFAMAPAGDNCRQIRGHDGRAIIRDASRRARSAGGARPAGARLPRAGDVRRLCRGCAGAALAGRRCIAGRSFRAVRSGRFRRAIAGLPRRIRTVARSGDRAGACRHADIVRSPAGYEGGRAAALRAREQHRNGPRGSAARTGPGGGRRQRAGAGTHRSARTGTAFRQHLRRDAGRLLPELRVGARRGWARRSCASAAGSCAGRAGGAPGRDPGRAGGGGEARRRRAAARAGGGRAPSPARCSASGGARAGARRNVDQRRERAGFRDARRW